MSKIDELKQSKLREQMFDQMKSKPYILFYVFSL